MSETVRAARQLLAEALRKEGALCDLCAGTGTRWYASTATWRGGAGGQSPREDTCDKCWGTGRTDITGLDQRAAERHMREWSEDQVLRYLGDKLGANMSGTRCFLLELAAYCEKQTRRRKVPDGVSPFWHAMTWEAMRRVLARLAATADPHSGQSPPAGHDQR